MSSETELIAVSTLAAVQAACAENIALAQSFLQAALLANQGKVQEAAAQLTEVHDQTDDLRLLFMAFQFFFRTGDMTRAMGITNRRIQIARREDKPEPEARALSNLGLNYLTLGEHTQAKQCGEQALAINERIGHQLGIARDLGHLANVYELIGELDQAENLNYRGLAIAKSIDAHEMVAGKLANLGDIAFARGNHLQAGKLWQQAMELFEHIGVRKWHTQLKAKLESLPITQVTTAKPAE